MSRRKRWEESEIKDGFGQVRVLKWGYFMDYIEQEMLNFGAYVWRGQRCDNWMLKSTLDRLIEKARVARTRQPDFRSGHLDKFMFAVRGRRGSNPPPIQDENEWWALGQHHGLATPLLDWTESPFLAAYFAFIGKGSDQTRHRSIYALHRSSIERKVKALMQEEKTARQEKKKTYEESGKPMNVFLRASLEAPIRPEFEFIRPRSDENQRLVNQNGLFTRAPGGMTVESWVQEHFTENTKSFTLMKILVPNSDREDCLRVLNRMNINHLTLFPDLYGASKFCNLNCEIENY